MSIDSIAKINQLRTDILEGRDPSPEELHDAYAFLRSQRVEASQTAADAATKKKSKKAANSVPTPSLADLDDLLGL